MTTKLDNNYILVGRLDNKQEWSVISNPDKSSLDNAARILANPFNDYVEWSNCGVVYRVVRAEDLGQYNDLSRR